MLEKVLIKDSELDKFSDSNTLADRTRALVKHQLKNWDMARDGYSSLDNVQTRKFEFEDFIINVQFNPGRIISSSAKVDEKSINERPCFLCYKNLPDKQKGIKYFRDYLILVNPFPIFTEHLTIPKIDHIPQTIKYNFGGLLRLSEDIGKHYVVFYNGPKCGASAPDHMHFQAGSKDFMPIDSEYKSIRESKGELLFSSNDLAIYGFKNYLRYFFSIESGNASMIKKAFAKFYSLLGEFDKSEEPMMNILSYYHKNFWKILIFPRQKHRPSYYYESGEKNILLSPAAVDLGGVCITPREKDFNTITRNQLIDIMRQVTITKELFQYYSIKISGFDFED
jgi:ATP adenylyltransferase/5',5'''-P-1,P-4-tetraphosphate phosphorylase II